MLGNQVVGSELEEDDIGTTELSYGQPEVMCKRLLSRRSEELEELVESNVLASLSL